MWAPDTPPDIVNFHPIASERAGHLPAAITLGLYRHFTKTLQLDAAERVDMAIRKALEGRN